MTATLGVTGAVALLALAGALPLGKSGQRAYRAVVAVVCLAYLAAEPLGRAAVDYGMLAAPSLAFTALWCVIFLAVTSLQLDGATLRAGAFSSLLATALFLVAAGLSARFLAIDLLAIDSPPLTVAQRFAALSILALLLIVGQLIAAIAYGWPLAWLFAPCFAAAVAIGAPLLPADIRMVSWENHGLWPLAPVMLSVYLLWLARRRHPLHAVVGGAMAVLPLPLGGLALRVWEAV